MADLGNLWYSLGIKDNTQNDLQRIVQNIRQQLGNGVNITCNQQQLNALLTSLRNFLNEKQVYVKLTPSVPNKEMNDLRQRLSKKLENLKVKGVQLTVDRAKVQADLNAKPFTANLLLAINRAQLQAAINGQLALTAAQARGVRAGQQQIRTDDLHAESLLRQQKLQGQINNLQERSVGYQKSISGQMKTTTQLATILGNAMGKVFSVYAVRSFLTEVVRVGGELEKQRLAMRSILGNASEADEIYAKLKNLSMISPFDVEDLVTYTKQLSAFGIQYSDLYETAKRLSDIAAGVGVSFSRIAYEYGQTSARGWLDGRELRMFANSGIPLLEKLSKHYSDLRNEIVSTAEVRKMVSNREVSFKDVQAVLWQMTDEGGEFYQMQEVMAESLAAKWRNLGNAWNLMMGDIAEGTPGDMLKSLAEGLTALTKHWSELSGVLSIIAIRFAASKAAMMAQSAVIGKHASSVIEDTLAIKQQNAEELRRVALTRELTIIEKQKLADSNALLLGDYKRLVTSKQLTASQAAMAMAYGQGGLQLQGYSKRMLIAEMRAMGFTKSQMRLVLTMRNSSSAMKALSTTVLGLGEAFKTAGRFIASNWLTIALMAVAELAMKFVQAREEYNEMVNAMSQKGNEGLKDIDKTLKDFGNLSVATASAKELKTALDEIKESVREYDPDWANTFSIAFSSDAAGYYIKNTAEQYEYLRDRMIEVKGLYKWLADNPSIAADAIKVTGNWANDDVVENANDWHNALQRINSVMMQMGEKDLLKSYNDVIAILTKNSSKFTEEQLAEWEKVRAKIEAATTTIGKMKALMSSNLIWSLQRTFNLNGNSGISDQLTNALGGKSLFMNSTLYDYYDSLSNARVEFNADTKQFAESLDTAVSKFFNKDTQPGEYSAAIHASMKMAMDKTNLTDEEKAVMAGNIDRLLNIKVQYQYNNNGKNQVNDFQQLGIQAVDEATKSGKTVVDAILKSSNVGDIQEALKKIYDDAEKELKKLETKDPGWTQKQWDEYKLEQEELKASAKAAMDAMHLAYETTNKNSGKDVIKESFQQRLRLIKEMYSEYKSWLSLVKNEEEAMKRTNANPSFVGSGVKNPADIIGNYQKLMKDMQAYGTKYSDLILQANAGLFNFDKDEMKRNIDEAVSMLKERLDKDLEQWNLYKKLFEVSGDKNWSMKMAGSGLQVWDGLSSAWAGQLENAMFLANGDKIDINWKMSEKEAEKFFGSNGELLTLYLKTKERIEKNGIDLLGSAADGLKSMDNLDARIQAITDEMERALSQTQDTKVIEGIRKHYNDQINQLKRELYEGSDVYKKLTQDTANLGMKKLSELRTLARGVRDAINGGTSQKDKNGNISYNFAYDQKEYNASESAVKSLLKLIDQLEKKADNATEAMKRLFSGKNAKGDAASFGEYMKDLSSVFGYFSTIVGQLQQFGGSSEFQSITKVIGQVSTAMQSFSSAAEKFDAGDYAGGASDSLSGAVAMAAAANDSKNDNWKEYEKMRDRYTTLIGVWDQLIEKKREYISQSWGEETKKTEEEIRSIMNAQIDIMRATANEMLGAGASLGSHSVGYRMWEGSYTSVLNGNTWSDVAGEIESNYGVRFKQMSDLINMDAETLRKIREEYPDLWAAMDTDVKIALDSIISYGDELDNLEKTVNESLTDTTWDNLRSGFDSIVKDMNSTWLNFVDNFEESLYNAIVKQKLTEILGNDEEGPLAEYYKMFADAMASDGGLDDAEVEMLRAKYEEIAKKVEKVQGEASSTSGWKGGSASALSSSISGVSADEVGAMAAYLNGIRADASVINATATAQLAQLNMQTEYLRIISEHIVGCEEHMDTLKSDIHAVTNGTKSMSVK